MNPTAKTVVGVISFLIGGLVVRAQALHYAEITVEQHQKDVRERQIKKAQK